MKNNKKSKLFFPKFLKLFPKVAYHYDLKMSEAALYGFIHYYFTFKRKNGEKPNFFFTNEQLAIFAKTSEATIKRAFKTLIDKKIITVSYAVRGGGGQIRFVNSLIYPKDLPELNISHYIKASDQNDPSEKVKMICPTGQNDPTIENKKKENKINKNNTLPQGGEPLIKKAQLGKETGILSNSNPNCCSPSPTPVAILPPPPTDSLIIKENFNKWIEYFNRSYSTHFKPTDKLQSWYVNCLKIFKPTEMTEALKNAINDPFYGWGDGVETDFKMTPGFVLKDTNKIDEFLNLK